MIIYYFYLYPETFFFKGKNKMLLYNAQTGKMLEVVQDSVMLQIQEELQNPDNLYCFQLNEWDFYKYKTFLDRLIAEGFGNLSGTSYHDRSVSYPPILKLNHGIDSIRADHRQGQDGYILDYLHEITIHLSGNPHVKEQLYYQQVIYPVKTDQRLENNRLLKWLQTTRGGALKVVNILCSLQFIDEYWDLFNLLKELRVKINYYIHYSDLYSCKITPELLSLCNLVVIYEKEGLMQIQNIYDALCIVTATSDLALIENYLSDNKITIVPVYTHANRSFFEKHVFTTKDELLTTKLSKKEIFTKMEINTNFFGKLTILPTGEI